MKKKSILSLVLLGALSLSIVGCTGKENKEIKDDKTITIGVSPNPHKGIVETIIPDLESKGYEVVVKEFDDYVLPNIALDQGELDANFFQHEPYLNKFNKEHETKITYTASIHLEPLGAYSKKIKSIDELKDGSKVCVPNDPSNEARALRLLESAGLIKVKDGETVTVRDIIENPKNLKFEELEAKLLTTVIDDFDLAVINGNYALQLFTPSKDALLLEDKDSEASKPYGNILAVKEGTENTQKIKDLTEALTSDKVKNYINDTFKDGSVIPVF